MVRSLRLLVPALAVLIAAGVALLFAPATQAQTDTTDPTVESVAFTSEGPYMEGDPIEVTVTFSEPVHDTGSTYYSQITLLVGTSELATPRTLNPSPQSAAASTIVFTHIVTDRDGEGTVSVEENSLGDNAQYLRDADGNQLGSDPQHAGVDGGDEHYIDHTAPTLQTVAVTTSGPYGVGSTIKITATFNDNMGPAPGATLKFQIGGAEKTATYSASDSSEMSVVFAYTVVDGDEGAVTIPANPIAGPVADRAGNEAVAVGLEHAAVAAAEGQTVDPEVVVTLPDSTDTTGTADTTAPAVTYSKPGSLTVGIRIRAIAPKTDDTDIASYAEKDGSSLPSMLRLDGATGNITGRPTRAVSRSTNVTIVVCDTSGNCADATLSLPAIVDPEAEQQTTVATLPDIENPDLSAVNVGDAAPSTALRAAIALTGVALLLGGMLALRRRKSTKS